MTISVRPVAAALAALTLSSSLAATALAAWSTSGSGAASGAATTMPAGHAPTATASGTSVTVSWPTATFANGAGVAGYVIHRYDAVNGAAATVGAGCSGTVTTTSCVEQSVPAGNWIYTDVPVQGGWTGAESSPSNSVTVPAPASTQPVQTTRVVVSGGPPDRPAHSVHGWPVVQGVAVRRCRHHLLQAGGHPRGRQSHDAPERDSHRHRPCQQSGAQPDRAETHTT
jgi:hypothetical protein